MKTNNYLKLFLLFFLSISGCSANEANLPIDDGSYKVAFISHTYYVNRHKDVQQMFIDEINAANPKYIFALGDIVLWNRDEEWKKTLDFFSKFNAKVYYSPGNHDIFDFTIVEGLATDRHYPKWRKNYVEQIGYAQTMVSDDSADFVLINSNDPFFKSQPFLDESLKKANANTPTLLLTHQRIWLDRFEAVWVHWYFKSTKKEEVTPYISKFDQVVIGDLWGKLEMKNIENTPIAMIGMGNNDKPPFWVLGKLEEGKKMFTFEQKTIALPENHPYIHRK